MRLKSNGRTRLVGESACDGNHFGGSEPVGGELVMFVPVGHTTDPRTRRDWENVGVQSDVAVPADQALGEALRQIHEQAAATTSDR